MQQDGIPIITGLLQKIIQNTKNGYPRKWLKVRNTIISGGKLDERRTLY